MFKLMSIEINLTVILEFLFDYNNQKLDPFLTLKTDNNDLVMTDKQQKYMTH